MPEIYKSHFVLTLVLFTGLFFNVTAQFSVPLISKPQFKRHEAWVFSTSRNSAVVGDKVDLIFDVDIEDQWYIYSSNLDPSIGPTPTSFTFEPHNSYKLIGPLKYKKPKKKFEQSFDADVSYYTGKTQFIQTVQILDPAIVIKGEVAGQICSDQCIQFDTAFVFNQFKISPVAAKKIEIQDTSETLVKNLVSDTNQVNIDPTNSSSLPKSLKNINVELKERGNFNTSSSLWKFIFVAFTAGIFALVTPCVFPMVPMTVAFFTNSSRTKAQAIKKAILYGVSIVFIYGIIGLIIAPFNGPDLANIIATHWAPNLLFFGVFFFFGLSFLGLFDISLPSSFVNKVDAQSDQEGIAGVFFMAFTIVIVSFSCTAPIVGSILVLAAGGAVVKPVLGMLSYAMAFAIPFTLFAMFPNWLNKLPKSGGWLNVIKVTLGFIELALGLKFLSVADQVYHWNILDREVYIAIWFVLFIVLGVYLLGKIRLPHDTEIKFTPVPRLILAIISFSFSAYLLPGLFGAPLRALSGYLPPLTTHDFDIPGIIRQYSSSGRKSDENVLCEDPKYGDKLHLPHGLQGFYDYKQAIKCAREKKRPLFIDFTGHGCVNCREMEANVWSDPAVMKILRTDFIIVALYTDDPSKVHESEIYTSTYDNKKKLTIGSQNADLQISKFKNNAQPYYILLDPFSEQVLAQPIGYEGSIPKFIDFLKEGLVNFKKYSENSK